MELLEERSGINQNRSQHLINENTRAIILRPEQGLLFPPVTLLGKGKKIVKLRQEKKTNEKQINSSLWPKLKCLT